MPPTGYTQVWPPMLLVDVHCFGVYNFLLTQRNVSDFSRLEYSSIQRAVDNIQPFYATTRHPKLFCKRKTSTNKIHATYVVKRPT